MRWISRTLVGFILVSALGCATIEYHFDPGAAPQWTRGGDSQADGELRAVDAYASHPGWRGIVNGL